MTVIMLRDSIGRLLPGLPRTVCTVERARELYEGYLAAVCRHQGLYPNEVKAQLARPGRPTNDREWRRAAYARQLAVYLANIIDEVPQARLADVTGLSKMAITLMLRSIEDLRDVQNFDANVDLVAASMEVQP